MKSFPKLKDTLQFRNGSHKKFLRLREELEDVLSKYGENPTDTELIDRSSQLLSKLEQVKKEETQGYDYERAVTNTAITSSRIKRTHYAAYIAGKTSGAEDIGDKFKCWMHNSAANGAMVLGETLDDIILLHHKEKLKSNTVELIKVFRNGAFEDAARILVLSESFDSDSPLTRYNKAKLDILSKQQNLRENGIDALINIDPPNSDCHPAEIAWHKNNFEMFSGNDNKMRNIIETHHAYKLTEIKSNLKKNHKIAKNIEKARGNIWIHETSRNKLSITVSNIGSILMLIYMAVVPENQALIMELLVNSANWIFNTANAAESFQYTNALIGDGGLASTVEYVDKDIMNTARELLRTTFGDGGIA